MAIVTVGIDLAKKVFAVHGVDESGKPALVRPEVARAKLIERSANLAPCRHHHSSAVTLAIFLAIFAKQTKIRP